MTHAYDYARPAVAVDCVVFGIDGRSLEVLLVERGETPFRGQWALPGGFVRIDETLDDAAQRELQEETGVRAPYLEQLYTFGTIDRDPRERVVSVAYYALVKLSDRNVRAATDASDAAWFELSSVPDLAFDHDHILAVARQRLQGKVRYQPLGFELLPRKFTLSQLQAVYETVLERTLDKRNFRKKVLKTELLVELDEFQKDVSHRAARLYRFDARKYRRLARDGGFLFEI